MKEGQNGKNRSANKDMLNMKRLKLDKSSLKTDGKKGIIQDWWEESTIKNLKKKQEKIAQVSNLVLSEFAQKNSNYMEDVDNYINNNTPVLLKEDDNKKRKKISYYF